MQLSALHSTAYAPQKTILDRHRLRQNVVPAQTPISSLNLSQFKSEPEVTYIGQNLYIRANYVVSMPEYSKPRDYFSYARVVNQKNLVDNKHRGKVSAKAMKEIKNSVNWLVHGSKEKSLYHAESKRTYTFKVNFITLTLPDTNQTITDLVFKRDLMEPLLATLRKGYDLKNYVWKLELQANGKIHAHITSDTFIWWKDLRRLWNKRLAAVGIIKAYKEKFAGCSFEQYLQFCSNKDRRTLNEKRLSWQKSTEENWSNPNSTDVHAVYKIDDVAAYVSKYMAKDSDKLSTIKGRIWGCNYEISRNRKPRLFIDRHSTDLSIPSLFRKQIRWLPINSYNEVTKIEKKIGEIFLLSQNDWNQYIKGEIRDVYNSTLAAIQRSRDLFEFNSIVVSNT